MGAFTRPTYAAPYIKTTPQQREPEIFFASPDDAIKKGVNVAAGTPHVTRGDILGRITATGKYRRLTRAALAVAAIATATSVVLKSTTNGVLMKSPFKLGEALTINGEANHVVTDIDETTGTITFAPGLTGAAAIGASVVLTTPDGSETAVGISNRSVSDVNFNPGAPNVNNMLPVDFMVDCILSGWLRRSTINGLDATSINDLKIADLSPGFDCIQVR